MGKVLGGLIAIAIGVGGAVVLFWVLNYLVERLPAKWEERVKPYVFVGPALAFIGVIVLYPLVRTLIFAFFDETGDEWVGFDNFSDLLGSDDFRQTLFNNLLWLLFVPAGIVIAGLAVAVLADRLGPRSEKIAKSIIFVPLAISFVGAATIWRFVYESRPAGQPQIGLLERGRHLTRLRPDRVDPEGRVPSEHVPADGGRALAPGGVRDGPAVGRDQGRAAGDHRGVPGGRGDGAADLLPGVDADRSGRPWSRC